MSARVDQFCDNLRDRLNTMEGRFNSLKANVQAVPKRADQAVRGKLDEARRKLGAQKQHVEQACTTLKTRAHEKVTESEDAVHEWKAKREARKLGARADRAESYAAAAIDHAAASLDEADQAILDAIEARLDADEAQPS